MLPYNFIVRAKSKLCNNNFCYKPFHSNILEEAVVHSFEDVERIKEKIRKEEELGILRRFKETRNDTNESMDYLTSDFEQMKNNCAEDIQMTGKQHET